MSADSRMQPQVPWLRIDAGMLALDVHLQPGARRSEIVGEHGGRLKIALRSPPVDGRANDELLRFLAAKLDLPRSAVSLAAGATQRTKRIAIAVPATRHDDVLARLLAPAG
ncbi:MAG TPA: DUF167 domain-containing protein [Burkholderiaceae bacterium]|nr:DUF167 domain-containing protein [Burkholderiaceae bacterium]